MTAGLQLFNADGTLDLDATYSIPKFIRVIPVETTVSNGSVYIPEWETQQPWFVATTTYVQTPLYTAPKIWVEGAYIKWQKGRFSPEGQSIIVGHR